MIHDESVIEEAEKKPLLAAQEAEECLKRLEKSINQHDETLVQYDKAASVFDKRIESLLQTVNDQKEQIANYNKEAAQTEHHISEAIESVESVLKEIETLVRFQTSLKRSFNAVRDDFTNSQKVILKDSRKYNHEMKKGHSERKSGTMQIYFTQKGNLMQELEKELQTRLSSKLGNVNFLLLDDKSKVDDRMLLIIVCIVSSRFGADARHVMKKMKDYENAVLLIIHCTDSPSTSNKNSSHHLTGFLFERLRGIFDLTYMRGYGFVACEMNDRSIIRLSEICKQPVLSEML